MYHKFRIRALVFLSGLWQIVQLGCKMVFLVHLKTTEYDEVDSTLPSTIAIYV